MVAVKVVKKGILLVLLKVDLMDEQMVAPKVMMRVERMAALMVYKMVA